MSQFPSNVLRRAALVSLAACTVLAGFGGPQPASAADVEVYFSSGTVTGTNPNILFILDTSQSMYTTESDVPGEPYDPAKNYGNHAGCDSSLYYWATVGGSTPNCRAAGIVGITNINFQCTSWKAAVNAKGFQTGLPNGNVPSKVAQGSGSKWASLDQQNKATACQGDSGNSGPANWGPIRSAAYTFYSGNYLNYLQSPASTFKYRIDIMREVVARLAKSTAGVNMGLMRFGYDGSRVFLQNTATACEVLANPIEDTRGGRGAPIVYPVVDIEGRGVDDDYFNLGGDTAVEQFLYELGVQDNGRVASWVVNPSLTAQPQRIAYGGGSTCPIPLFTPGGRSPLGGAMHEAYLYYSGQQWSLPYGQQAALGSTFGYPSVAAARLPGSEVYKSPITDGCQKNFIILLSDGTTEQDNSVDGPIQQLPNFQEVIGSNKCDTDPYLDDLGTPPPSQCVDDMAQYLFETDMRPGIAGIQNVLTYTVGFKLGADLAANSARNLLSETAKRGGGLFYEAANATELEGILVELVRQILVDNTSFTAPAVSVNAFNRLENIDDVYISLFRPALSYRWRGNVKKYKLNTDPASSLPIGELLDSTGSAAVNPATGFFRDSAKSYWADLGVIDGGDVTLGGAQAEIRYVGRNVYSNLTGTSNVDLTLDANDIQAIKGYDLVVKRALMGWAPGDAIDADGLVDWVQGMDVADIDGDTVVAEDRYNFGDPLHSRASLAIYGGTATSRDIDDAVLYVTTNDGYLHAINPVDGSERWSFVPKNLLPRARNLMRNEFRSWNDRSYGLDGTIRLVQVDNNDNGVIETANGDKVYLFFGQRRGGDWFYGLDVTSKTQPRLMWAIDASSLPGAGQSWSTPEPARVNINGTVTPVLFIGGGYAPATQDQQPYSADSVGNRIFMVHALTGALLWTAGPSGSGANLELAAMRNAIPSAVRPVDLSDDGLADRIYVADLGARLFRFDIMNGKPVIGTEGDRLIEGGLFASLGNAEDVSRVASNTLRFFSPPDPSLQKIAGIQFINLAIGSGHRELPKSDTVTQDWFFGVRDYRVFAPLLSSQYQSTCPDPATGPCHEVITEADLVDLTSTVGDAATAAVGPGTAGWRFELGLTGEKSLGESVTLQGTVLFTTYTPQSLGVTADGCAVRFGTNHVYAVSAVDARPANNRDGDATEEAEDRTQQLASTGTIAPPPTIVFPPAPADCDGPECRPRPIAYCGLELCGGGMPNSPVRTFWRQRGVE